MRTLGFDCLRLPTSCLRPLFQGRNICSAKVRRFFLCASSGVVKERALVGQALTQAGISLSGQRSHLVTNLLPGERVIAPKGQASSQKPHPMQRLRLCSTIAPCLYIAPVGHTLTQKASSQCRQLTGTDFSPACWTKMRLRGCGSSKIAPNNSFPAECSTAQAISQDLQPTHLPTSICTSFKSLTSLWEK